jgi:hypothetical protein
MWGSRGQALRIFSNNLFKAISVATPLLAPLAVRVPALAWLKNDVLRASASLAILAVIFFFEGRDLYVAQLKGRDFRAEYMKEVTKPIADRIGKDLRFNVMYARRRWYFLWLARDFEWDEEQLGFTPGRFHFDQKLWLTEWQGVCGQALRKESVAFAELPGASQPHWLPWRNPYGLFRGQVLATTHVRAVLSVPMLLKRKGMQPLAVGVINVDAVSDDGVDFLADEYSAWEADGQGEVVPKLLAAGSMLAVVS